MVRARGAPARRRCDCETKLALQVEMPFAHSEFGRQRAFAELERLILRNSVPVVYLSGAYRHCTVLSGYTPASLRLFDSYEYRFLRRRACGVKAGTAARHHLHLQTMLVFSV